MYGPVLPMEKCVKDKEYGKPTKSRTPFVKQALYPALGSTLLVRGAVVQPFTFDAVLDNPRVVLNIAECDTLLRVQNEQLNIVSSNPQNQLLEVPHLLDQVLGLRAHICRDRHLSLGDPPLGHDRRVFKRCLSTEKLVRQNTQRPEIDLLVVPVVVLSAKHLRWKIIEGTTHGLSPVVRRVYRPTKVTDLDLTVDSNQDVLWLDITVNDMLLVEIL